jgi:hypothetical protein
VKVEAKTEIVKKFGGILVNILFIWISVALM